ncbi:MAG: tetraacyldisaccharide 4'-kinase [Proteobacteria bacterium]|nr:tetraacyldisaccharide 4'-kinase [Pseudomonadota bacterium]
MIRLTAPAFWFDRNANVKLLKPLSVVWRYFTRLRIACAPSYIPHAKVICVGNVTVGGAGKTPFAISLMDGMREAGMVKRPCFLTRGFGGRTTGPAFIDAHASTVNEYGDEALLLVRHAPTIVAKNRADGLRYADEHGFDTVIADDGFQNPDLAKTISILIFDGAVGIGNGHCIPAGPCREPLADALPRAAACIVVGQDQTNIREQLLSLPTFAAHFKAAYNLSSEARYLAFAGIGRPEKFFETLRECNYNVVKTVAFPDHHHFTASDIEALVAETKRLQARLITTEKDFTRLPESARSTVDVLPVNLKVDGMPELLTLIRTRLGLCA